MDVPDIYATAKSNLRDNVKILIAVFGGVAGVLLAGTPFSGFGKLDFGTVRFYLASISLVVASGLVSLAFRRLLAALEPDLAYPTALKGDFDFSKVPSNLHFELKGLRSEFSTRLDELLPEGVKSIEELQTKLKDSWNIYNQIENDSKDKSSKTKKVEAREACDEWVAVEMKINHWAAFTRMKLRIKKSVDEALLLGMIALIFIGTFSWAVGSTKDRLPSVQTLLLTETKQSDKTNLPVIQPILFETNEFRLSDDSIKIINMARDYLQNNKHAGMLVYAYTDTKGDIHANQRLAANRAKSVTQALIKEGGVSSSRVFVSELPEINLPKVTNQEIDEQLNRSVNLVLFPIPGNR